MQVLPDLPVTDPASMATAPQLDLSFPIETILTGFDPTLLQNSNNPCSIDKGKNAEWTDEQREAASKGVVVQDVMQLRALVSSKQTSLPAIEYNSF